MKKHCIFLVLPILMFFSVKGQEMVKAANNFIGTLKEDQKAKALYPFDSEERFRFFFVPRDDRKGISMNEMTTEQQHAAEALIRTAISEKTAGKVAQIMQLEKLLQAIEKRGPADTYRNPGKYFISLFGIPGEKNIWGWRLEGHHVSFHFSSNDNRLVSGTPGFLGSNPAEVLEGPEKGKFVLREETEAGFTLLQMLTKAQMAKALINTNAPGEIITSNQRNAQLVHPEGLGFGDMNRDQQQAFLQLVNIYVQRYTRLFADDMLKEIQQAGLDQLKFTWAGSTEKILGKAYYYRVQGPTLLIEYDNSQNNANHIHTVVRDLLHDFGGDALLQHYRSDHSTN